MTLEPTQTVTWAPWLWDGDEIALDDPAEHFHETSRLYPRTSTQTRGAHLLAANAELQASVARATKRLGGEAVALPAPAASTCTWDELVAARRTVRAFADEPVPLPVLAALLHAAYGFTSADPPLRTTPSGGALYPLELYVAAHQVGGLAAGVYHFDPFRRVVELLRAGDVHDEIAALTVYPELFTTPALVAFVSGMFWRARMKYGLRGYRFALLEAGHVAQNLLLAAVAHGLGAVAVGGFYDRRVDEFLEVDGLDEAALYAVAVGVAA